MLLAIGLMFFAGAAVGAVQMIFLCIAFCASGYFCIQRRFADYVILLAWLLTLTPLFRRLHDVNAGYQDVSVIMLAPYIAMLWSVPYVVMTFRPKSITWAFVAIFACALYGLLFAIAGDRAVAGTFDFLRWTLPPMVGLAIFQSPAERERLKPKLLVFAALFAVLTSIYGVYQYVYIPRWDAEWMYYSKMGSIGFPLPFQARVFSTLNSPGSYAGILVLMLLLLMGAGSTSALAAVAIGALGFGLTLVRAAWIGFGVGLVMIAMMGSLQARSKMVVLLLVAIFSAPPLLVATGTDSYVGDRFSTLFDLKSDHSLDERSGGYDQMLLNLNDAVLGRGLAINGAAAAKSGEGQEVMIDGGPIEVFYALGLPVGLIYLVAVLVLAAAAFFNGTREDSGTRAAVAVNVLLLTSGTVTIGEIGIFFWILVGITLPNNQRTRQHSKNLISHFIHMSGALAADQNKSEALTKKRRN